MRRTGAHSLRLICLVDLDRLGPEASQKCVRNLFTSSDSMIAHIQQVKLLEASDNSDVHGGLVGLTELALAYQELHSGDLLESKKRNVSGLMLIRDFVLIPGKIFRYLSRVPESTLLGPRNEIVTAAACEFITQTITSSEIALGAKSSVSNWRKIVEYGLKHRDIAVQEAATATMGAISRLVDSSTLVLR